MEELKESFIKAYRRNSGVLYLSLRECGIGYERYAVWMSEDEGFRGMVEAVDRGVEDEVEKVVLDKAIDGNINAGKFILEKRHRRYKKVEGGGGVNMIGFDKGDFIKLLMATGYAIGAGRGSKVYKQLGGGDEFEEDEQGFSGKACGEVGL